MTLYCQCETPVMDVEHDAGCRRCGRPVDFTPKEPDETGDPNCLHVSIDQNARCIRCGAWCG